MITNEIKTKVLAAMAERREMFPSDAKFAIFLGLHSAQYSRIKDGKELDRVISESTWITIALKLDINLKESADWVTAETVVFKTATLWLSKCQKDSISAIWCDDADVGKTYAAKMYVQNKANKNAVHIDCSQVKSKQKLVREIAKQFGVDNTGKYSDVYATLTMYLRILTTPLVILDEAGDLNYDAFLEIKGLWNATEGCCGWFMMGADGLKEKVRRAIDCKKVGYTEIFSRFGKRYQRATPESTIDFSEFMMQEAAQIIKANAPADADVKTLLTKCAFSKVEKSNDKKSQQGQQGSLRRIRTEISKIK